MNSASDFDVNCFSVDEPRMELNNERSFAIIQGGETVTYRDYPRVAGDSASMTFITNPPGNKNVLDRICLVEMVMTATYVGGGSIPGPGSSVNDLMFQSGRDAIRANPISAITQTLTATINGFPVTIELSECIQALQRFHNPLENRKTFGSLNGSMLDNYQMYADSDASARNPLAPYYDSEAEISRGSNYMTITNNTNTSATVVVRLREYIVLPPFIFDSIHGQAGGLTNLDTLQFNFVLANLPRMFSRSTLNTVPIGSLVIVPSDQKMRLCWITPKLTQPIPPVMKYPYFKVSKYISDNGQVAVPFYTETTISSQVIQFDTIPRKLYIYVRQSNNPIQNNPTTMMNATDTFCKIDRINISWDNIDGVLSGASDMNLYDFSVQNGLNYSYQEWSGKTQTFGKVLADGPPVQQGLTGGICCIELGKDLGLKATQAEGVLSKINFQVEVRFQNINVSQPSYIPALYVLAVYDGILSIGNNSCVGVLGVINESRVLSSPASHSISYNHLEKLYGGSFFSAFKNIAGKVYDTLKDTKVISKTLGSFNNPYSQAAANVASSLGLGHRHRRGSAMGVGAQGVGHRRRHGGVLYGGADDEDEYEEEYEYEQEAYPEHRGGRSVSKDKLRERMAGC
jgi:hypothetical protein